MAENNNAAYTIYRDAIEGLRLPLAFIDLDAFAADIAYVAATQKTSAKTIRVASRSIRIIDLRQCIFEIGWYLIVEQAENKATREIFITLLMNLAIGLVVAAMVLLLVSLTIKAYQSRIETLRGIVPICSFCKQVRDDQGYWNQVEAYVSKHTDATFSPGSARSVRESITPDTLLKMGRVKPVPEVIIRYCRI